MIQPIYLRLFLRWLMSAWMSRWHPLALMLWPLSVLYASWVGRVRKRAFSKTQPDGLFLDGETVPLQIWVVGNWWVGGAGKTPLVQALANRAARCGLQVAIVSRGYGSLAQSNHASTQGARLVTPTARPEEVGDEPFWLAQTTGLPVCVGPDRSASIAMLQRHYPDLELIICDDGLFNVGLPRSHEIVVLDERGLGNGWCIPAGPLRIPFDTRPFAPGAQRIWVLSSSAEAVLTQDRLHPSIQDLQPMMWKISRRLADKLQRLTQPQSFCTFEELTAQKCRVGAFAGIAKPTIFFDMLVGRGLQLSHRLAYPDHQAPKKHNTHPWEEADWWICTAKDAVKLHDLPQKIRNKIWVADLALDVPQGLWKNLNLS